MAKEPGKPTRDDVLLRLLKTAPQPKASKPKIEPTPDNDDPEALMDWAKRHIQKE
ncbi:hypothetical protein [Pseudolabrys taiwanensis]|uniref:hypothetical protein n=1 Tax=Pseudolabrys taiwanensis TaxID=331696 RepID=UPI0013B3F16D|nr:hypothetical protein [Pseudolabrys taiwanensis]